MDNEKLTLELLHEIKQSGKRWFIATIVSIALLVLSNLAWLYAWCLPVDETVTTTTVESSDTGNANYINGNGDISNGKNNGINEKNVPEKTGQTERQ